MATKTRSRSWSRALAGVTVAGVAGLATFVGAGAASAATAHLTLAYNCTFPLIGDQQMTVDISANLPDSAVVNQMIPAITFTADVTVPETATQGLTLIGATTISGTATADATLVNGSLNLPLFLPLDVPETAVPASGAFDMTVTGTTPSIAFPNAGTAVITVGDFSTTLDPKTADGSDTGLGTFTSDCTLGDGQDNTLATIPVAES